MRATQVYCDGPGCTHEDGKGGSTDWITVKHRKKALDFHDNRCLRRWVEGLAEQMELDIETGELVGVN